MDKQKRILFVEDARTVRKMSVDMLRQIGYQNITEAENGRDAIEKLIKSASFDLIISDWNMPEKTGLELLEWVRNTNIFQSIPFIMATAQGEKISIQKAIDAGANDYLIKPFGPVELKRVIDHVLYNKKTDEESTLPYEPEITESGRVKINVAHIQITDHMILAVLKYLIDNKTFVPQHFELETQCMPSWNAVQEPLENGKVDGAFVLAPIAMDLFSSGTPINIILYAHKNGSICVRKKNGETSEELRDIYRNKIFYIPHLLSIHHMLAFMFMREIGLKPGLSDNPDANVFFEVVPPIKMPELIVHNEEVAGFMVAEPMGSKAINDGSAELMYLSSEIWDFHPCCVVAMQNKLIQEHPEAVQEFTNLLVRSGMFIVSKPETAAHIGVEFFDPNGHLGLTPNMLKSILQHPLGIKTDNLFPVLEDLEQIQKYMSHEMGIGQIIDVQKLIDSRFAQEACSSSASKLHMRAIQDIGESVNQIMDRFEQR
ncbi:response regulator receiver modulated CheW protein [Candidatus Magnetomorum sp. HK-1]|nr:response regulator receiver modulated CheW protein [Candidatus Magnetomorum sp. HK-1]